MRARGAHFCRASLYAQLSPLSIICSLLFSVVQSCSTRVPGYFQSWNPDVVAQLPLFVQESFPFFLTRKSAIHNDVIAEISDNLVHAKGFAASREALAQAHMKKFMMRS